MALFGEKYGDSVRVVSVPGFSLELCGGTHVSATGDIGFFVIVSEGGVAAGVRRIEARDRRWSASMGAGAAGGAATASSRRSTSTSDQAVDTDRTPAGRNQAARPGSHAAQDEARHGRRRRRTADDTVEVAGVKLARRKVADLDKDALRGLADSLKARIKSGIVVIASANDGKVQMVVAVTPDLTGRIKAGQIVKEIAPIVGGGGGGRPDFAEAGGKQPEKIDEMLDQSRAIVEKLLG